MGVFSPNTTQKSDAHPRQLGALTLLNDLQIMATAASSGQTDPVTGSVQQGAEQVAQALQRLATLDIMPYRGQSV